MLKYWWHLDNLNAFLVSLNNKALKLVLSYFISVVLSRIWTTERIFQIIHIWMGWNKASLVTVDYVANYILEPLVCCSDQIKWFGGIGLMNNLNVVASLLELILHRKK